MPFCTTCGSNVNGAFCPQCGTPISAAQAPPPPPPPQANIPPTQPFAPQPMQQGVIMPTPVPPRRGMHPLLIVLLVVFGIGFLCVVGVIGIGIYAAHSFAKNPGATMAKVLTMANPNIEVLSTDNDARTFRIRDKQTGEVSTISWDDAKKGGKFTISADDGHGGHGSVKFGAGDADIPSWVPRYPGASNVGEFSASGTESNGEGSGGSFSFTTSDSPRRVLDYYKDKAAELGLKVNMNTDMPTGGMIVAAEEHERRVLSVTASVNGNSTGGLITYKEKR
jgi:hypothetical protein